MPSSTETTQCTTAELMRQATDTASGLQDTQSTLSARVTELQSVLEQIPGFEKAIAGKQTTLSKDTTKVGGVTTFCSYDTKNRTYPAGGTWLVIHGADWKTSTDRAANVIFVVRPGGGSMTGSYSWWTFTIRIA